MQKRQEKLLKSKYMEELLILYLKKVIKQLRVLLKKAANWLEEFKKHRKLDQKNLPT